MKRFLSMLLLLPLVLSVAACGTEPAGTDESLANSSGSIAGSMTEDSSSVTDSQTQNTSSATDSQMQNTSSSTDTEGSTGTSTTTEEEVWEPTHVVDNLFLAGDQYNQDVLIYNLDKLEPGDDLDDAVVWSHHVGISHIAGLKYREDTVFGDVILVAAGATKGKAQMISYPEGKVLWSTDQAGNNPHCIEILPSGNIVVASSTGGTLRLFKTAALLENDTKTAATYTDTALYSAHGVLYDPKYQVLWGLGNNTLEAYEIGGSGAKEMLVRNDDMIFQLPTVVQGGHAIAADLVDPDGLFVSVNEGAFRFNKETMTFEKTYEGYTKVNRKTVKGLAHNQNGNFCLAVPNGGKGTAWEKMGYGGWCTDTLTFCFYKTKNMFYAQQYTSSKGSAFYKVIAFNGTYQ